MVGPLHFLPNGKRNSMMSPLVAETVWSLFPDNRTVTLALGALPIIVLLGQPWAVIMLAVPPGFVVLTAVVAVVVGAGLPAFVVVLVPL
ncbi:hypothetical protein KDI_09920 [Dictyobacter arantiisoli]|uniref:Uncharacterized protein n=1 Tax=Dictyobacter arantiisoli TaxID=2014874 RepID=A0A5A5T7R1_9CHLR|nr:hypothetical protein KDI_09920 [Dictyobacter arantiisoli]